MNPYAYLREYTKPTDKLLSLCCGIGFELDYSNTKMITGVDISKPYIDELKIRKPYIDCINMDALSFVKDCASKSYDVISFIDGLEHIPKNDGLEILKELPRIAKRTIILFTQEGYLRNEPHNAWGISGADEYQTHKSAWFIKELESMGYTLVASSNDISQHGEPYLATMFIYEVK